MDLGNQVKSDGDVEKAIHYYKLVVDAGNTDDLASIELLYQYGTEFEQSHNLVIEWYQTALGLFVVIECQDLYF